MIYTIQNTHIKIKRQSIWLKLIINKYFKSRCFVLCTWFIFLRTLCTDFVRTNIVEISIINLFFKLNIKKVFDMLSELKICRLCTLYIVHYFKWNKIKCYNTYLHSMNYYETYFFGLKYIPLLISFFQTL